MITNVITQVAGQQQPSAVTSVVKCDRPGCTNEASYNAIDKAAIEEVKKNNPWLASVRVVKTQDGREFLYCGDICEIEQIKSGVHNPPEQKRIIDNATPAAVTAAKAAADAARQSDINLKTGTGGPVLVQG
ncbi:MAG TPA: hypothetical protein VN843_09820 [Anaerolineales bacterium]|nr:hypothetical protein [Anaerolineales bacterium]